MFCYKCGYKLSDDAIFCQKCGTRLQPLQNEQRLTQDKIANQELNHEALRIYLDDLLALEVINKKLNMKLNRTNRSLSYLKNFLGLQAYLLHQYDDGDGYDRYKIYFFYDGNSIYLAMDKDGTEQTVYQGYWPCKYSTPFKEWREYMTPEDLSSIRNKLVRVDDNSIKSLIRFKYLSFSEGRKRTKKVLELYESFKQNEPEIYQNNIKKINEMSRTKECITQEVTEAKRLLQNAYAVNIIPKEFRNIYAVYYLREFINSSRESLTTALLHFNLNEIKRKLDTIIVQQQEIIIQQAIMISQNNKLMQQNQTQLEKLSSIESNTELAAQYAEIASTNAEACAWIGLANYIK